MIDWRWRVLREGGRRRRHGRRAEAGRGRCAHCKTGRAQERSDRRTPTVYDSRPRTSRAWRSEVSRGAAPASRPQKTTRGAATVRAKRYRTVVQTTSGRGTYRMKGHGKKVNRIRIYARYPGGEAKAGKVARERPGRGPSGQRGRDEPLESSSSQRRHAPTVSLRYRYFSRTNEARNPDRAEPSGSTPTPLGRRRSSRSRRRVATRRHEGNRRRRPRAAICPGHQAPQSCAGTTSPGSGRRAEAPAPEASKALGAEKSRSSSQSDKPDIRRASPPPCSRAARRTSSR